VSPFKLRELVNGSHMIVDANDQFVLGRPKIDSIEVKFAADAQTLMTTVLAGAADLSLGARSSGRSSTTCPTSWSSWASSTRLPTLIGNRVKNSTARGPNSTDAWNGEQWELS
jgi:ABC-type transport system substrate-binding protein